MNKYKKIATAAVSVVMAGALMLPMAACKDGDKIVDPNVDANGKLTWAEGTSLNLNIGNNNSTSKQGITYQANDISGTVKMPDGKEYSAGNLKPAWQAIQDQIGVELKDAYQNLSSNNQITTPVTNNNMADYDMISGSLQMIVENSSNFLNLADYLDYMPNYKAFLEANPVTKYSLTASANGAMYAAPYFDGNDDIEKYAMANYLWVADILDNDIPEGKFQTTFKGAQTGKAVEGVTLVGDKASANSYMGKTSKWEVDTTDPADATKTIKLVVNYDAALTAAKNDQTELGAAIKTAAGKTYDGTSGNIVDLQNFAINEKKGEVKAEDLIKILRAYIKVAYQKADQSPFYTKLSDVFCSASAGWDVDLFVGISRCVVTCGSDLSATEYKTKENDVEVTKHVETKDIFAISGRQTTTQRRVDLTAFVGELYGMRGFESRLEYMYFNKEGKLQDARLVEENYDLLAEFSNLTKEGLVNIGSVKTGTDKDGKPTKSATSVNTNAAAPQTFMLHDYVQTQTKYGLTSETDMTKYNFAPIVNSVSKWDTTGDGTHETIMRFTESWRSVKNTGFCVPVNVAYNADKLSATLALIDYMFSTDGQLILSYGSQSTNGNTNPNGWWYANEATGVSIDSVATKVADATNYAPAQYKMKDANKSQYFVFNEKVYTGFAYNGTQVPIVTTDNMNFYLGKAVNGVQMNKDNVKINQKGNYTNYARYTIGSTLPVGNKNQGFEYQATSVCGIAGANTVNVALQNGTLKHVKLTLATGESPWYLIVPTALPASTNDQSTLKGADQTLISGTYFLNNSSTDQTTNLFIDLAYFGFAEKDICGKNELGKLSAYPSGEKMVELLKTKKMEQRLTIFSNGWAILNNVYKLGYIK